MRKQFLLVEDVEALGRSGDVVSVKPGYARNYLLPSSKAIVADKQALRMQARLQEERAKRAAVDKQDAEALSQRIEGMQLSVIVKVDPEGHMYGSVSTLDIIHLFAEAGIVLEKKNVLLAHPIKELGVFPIELKLQEDVPAHFVLNVESDEPLAERGHSEASAYLEEEVIQEEEPTPKEKKKKSKSKEKE